MKSHDPNKKTIALTIERGMVVRNLVNGDFYKLLTETYNVVVVTPLYDNPRLIKHLKGVVAIEPFFAHTTNRLEHQFVKIYKMLIYNPTVHIKSRYGFQHKSVEGVKENIKFWVNYVVFGLFLSKLHFLRPFWQWIDKCIFRNEYYDDLFSKYDFDAVFISNIFFTDEVYFVKSAKKRDVPVIGMTKSWDNFSKERYRVKADRLIVWNNFMWDEARMFQGYRDADMDIVGIPQFDIYHNFRENSSRDELVQLYDLDPNKKIILFGQESKALSPDDPYVVGLIRDWIKERAKNEWQILIRPHFAHPESLREFDRIVDNEIVFMDTINDPSTFRDTWDYSPEAGRRLALEINYADVVITSVATLILDGLALKTPVISYAFDDGNKAFKDSLWRLFEVLWFVDLRKTGLTKLIARSKEELFEKLADSDYKNKHKVEKQQIVDRFCYKTDGGAGRRIFESVERYLQSLEQSK